MATKKGSIESEGYNNASVIPGNKKVWFLNGDLVRVHHLNRSNGIMSVYNITKDRIESCLISDFKNNRERAYTVGETAELVNRHKKYMPSLMKRGIIPFPMGSQKGGARGWQVRSYYSESQVKEIRDILATYHIGRPRKDKLITNDITPSRQELTRRMGDGILTYVKTEDGRYIPVWSETL
jgi:hypothetical protein